MNIPTDLAQKRSARYEDLLRLREWQIFAHRCKEKANFACQMCRQGGPGRELNVHHWAYERDRLPWEYEAGEVAVLCKGCHGRMHDELQAFRRFVFGRLSPESFKVLNGSLAVGLERHDATELAYALAGLILSPGAIPRFAGDGAQQLGHVVNLKPQG